MSVLRFLHARRRRNGQRTQEHLAVLHAWADAARTDRVPVQGQPQPRVSTG